MPEDNKVELWNKYYRSLADSYLIPNEYVVRSFLGSYPKLSMEHKYHGSKVCDISCGDGRNIVLLNKLGLELYATEVSQDICDITRDKLEKHSENIRVDIRPGSNSSLPFPEGYFDYALSWNACYYMSDESADIADHVAEYARILKTDGYLVVSVPSPGCFSLIGAEELGKNLIKIKTNSKWSILNDSLYYRFDSEDKITEVFGKKFHNFSFAAIKDDCFGLPLEYFIFVCQKR